VRALNRYCRSSAEEFVRSACADALRTILELTSEDGVTGISEMHGGDAIAQGFNTLRAQVVGGDAFRLAGKLLP
jgi:hypothetical protein